MTNINAAFSEQLRLSGKNPRTKITLGTVSKRKTNYNVRSSH